MMESRFIDIKSFYDEVYRQLDVNKWSTLHYSSYGNEREKDCYYAVKIMGFQIINVGNKKFKTHIDTVQVPYYQIYNRPNANLDLQYLVAPDTRVPNYTTSVDDVIELANKIGIFSFPIPKWPSQNVRKQFINYILNSCDEAIGNPIE